MTYETHKKIDDLLTWVLVFAYLALILVAFI